MTSQSSSTHPNSEPLRRLRHDAYTITIICPMGDELSPVLALLDEIHENLSTSRDQNAYRLGKIGQHNVVIAGMPMIGNNAASMVITQLLNDFGQIRFGLLVGVGGGVPDEDYEDDDLNDIRLGDVVVSKSRGGYGGIVQFDRGKTTSEGFVKTGHENKPPHILAANVEALKADHNLHGNRILQHLREMLKKYPGMEEKYSYPGSERDRLFRANYQHQGGKTCKKCDVAHTIERRQRKSSSPRIHYGTIGSSNMVIENVQKRDELRNMGIICVEMEAAGLMEAFPCLVIRGISDYADSHKNKRWQPYAAATAAAYAKELLVQIPLGTVKNTQAITDTLQDLANQLGQMDQSTVKIENWTQSVEEKEILEWLSPKDIGFSSMQNASQRTHTPGTGQWLLNDERYKVWRDQNPGLLWLRGAAGCGKTILCSTIIHSLQQYARNSSTKSLAYWYFRFDNSNSQDLSKMLRSIIRQVSLSPLSPEIRALKDRHSQSGSEPSLEELTITLNRTLEILDGDVYIVVDALDECPHADKQGQRDKLLCSIKHLISNQRFNLHLLVTSRPEPDIWRELGSIASHSFDIEGLIKDDVARYVDMALLKPELANLDRGIQDRIRAKLLSFQERRFRWADLQIQRFARCPTLEHLETALDNIPKDLESSYQQAFDEVQIDYRSCVIDIMMWLTVSFRPLKADEVAAVVGFRSSDFLLRICTTLLVTIIEEDAMQIIKLSHFSVKEFLVARLCEENNRRWYRFSIELANKTVACTSLAALLDPNIQRRLILPYAARFWPQHARQAMRFEADPKLTKLINLLFDTDHTAQFRGWLKIYDPDEKDKLPFLTRPEPLYYASLLGLEETVRTLWVDDSQLSKSRGYYGNALNAAAVEGQVAVVRWIIAHSSDPGKFSDLVMVTREISVNVDEIFTTLFSSAPDFKVTEAILLAAISNTQQGEAVMRNLLDCQDQKNHITENVLKAAAWNERHSQKVMELLLEKMNNQVQITEAVVKAAAENEYSGRELMQLLLDKGYQIQITEAVLMAIAKNKYEGEKLIRLLLERKSDQIQITRVAITLIVRSFGVKVVELLLENMGERIQITETMVEAAAENVYSGRELMQLLLDKGHQIQITEAVLMAIAKNKYEGEKLMQLLLERKSDQIQITRVAITLIVRSFGVKVVELLLENIGERIQITETMVEAAAENWYNGEEMMQFLLERKGEDIQITEAVVTLIVRSFGIKVVGLFLKKTGDQIQITEAVVKAVAKNKNHGMMVMQLLLENKGGQIQITEAVVTLIVRSFGIKVVELFLEKMGDQIQITEPVVKAVAENKNYGRMIMQLLLEIKGDQIQITEAVVTLIVRSFGVKVVELFLEKMGDQFQITEGVVKAAAKNRYSGVGVMQLLLKRKGDNISFKS